MFVQCFFFFYSILQTKTSQFSGLQCLLTSILILHKLGECEFRNARSASIPSLLQPAKRCVPPKALYMPHTKGLMNYLPACKYFSAEYISVPFNKLTVSENMFFFLLCVNNTLASSPICIKLVHYILN